ISHKHSIVTFMLLKVTIRGLPESRIRESQKGNNTGGEKVAQKGCRGRLLVKKKHNKSPLNKEEAEYKKCQRDKNKKNTNIY
ncbi:MAG: hypothetical protein L6427_10925, partial [Actinomycetia bacterium]|nr:hypothetical protein [Actinomycetes bacterium]